jgi:predicted porin
MQSEMLVALTQQRNHMNKTLIVAAVSALTAGAAFAQSSVTVYGRFNTSAEQVELNGVKTKRLNDNASRIGFRGTEDMGGGLKANFVLEHGFDSSTGTPGARFWGRQSEVNLSGGFGMIRLGNFTSEAYFATADYISMHNHDTGNSQDELYAYLGRNGNKIAYRLPTVVKGLTAEAAVSASEGPGFRTYDGAINYEMGDLALGLGYEKAGDSNQFAVRGLYTMGAITLGGYVQRHDDATRGNRTLYRLSGMYALGASEFHVNYGKAGAFSKVSGSNASQWTLAYNYNLSKRTKVFAYYSEVDDAPGAKSVSVGDRTTLAAGIRHNF